MKPIMMQFSCRTYTMTSMSDGSSSTIMVEEWQPIFDRFDLESNGRMVGIILMLLMMLILLMSDDLLTKWYYTFDNYDQNDNFNMDMVFTFVLKPSPITNLVVAHYLICRCIRTEKFLWTASLLSWR